MKRPLTRLREVFGKHRLIAYAEVWKEVAGPALVGVSEFRGCVHLEGTLTLCIQIKDPVWRQEIFHQRKDLLSRYRLKLAQRGVEELLLPKNLQIRAH